MEELDSTKNAQAGSADEDDDSANKTSPESWYSRSIRDYLFENSVEYRELSALREKGWQNPKGDSYFKRQRIQADTPSKKQDLFFFKQMAQIAEELQQKTGAFLIEGQEDPRILDMCMAPGAFLDLALRQNPSARARAFTLPLSAGGNKIQIQRASRLMVHCLDITMLAKDMGAPDITEGHPDEGSFLPQNLSPDERFDLVLCNGQVLRPEVHHRKEYRERTEARRLTATQLALGLEHAKNRGTMIVLLHKVESVYSVATLKTFLKFSTVRLFKPEGAHATRSSFYLIASDIQRDHPEAVAAVSRWKDVWRAATFDFDSGNGSSLPGEDIREENLEEGFGPTLLGFGREIWRVQAAALRKASFTQGTSSATHVESFKTGSRDGHE